MRRNLSSAAVLLALALPAHAQGAEAGGTLLAPIFGLLVVIAVFLICRELMCWYWKINQAIALLTEIRDLLRNR